MALDGRPAKKVILRHQYFLIHHDRYGIPPSARHLYWIHSLVRRLFQAVALTVVVVGASTASIVTRVVPQCSICTRGRSIQSSRDYVPECWAVFAITGISSRRLFDFAS